MTPEEAEAVRSESIVRMRSASINLDAVSDLLDTAMLGGNALKNAYKVLATAAEEAEQVVSFYRTDEGNPIPEDVRAGLETMLQKQKDVLNAFVLKMALGS